MADDRRERRELDDELARRLVELDQLEPYLDLAREIRAEVARVAADDEAGADALSDLFDGFSRSERGEVARAVFERLAPEAQWAALERLFGDPELGVALAAEREARVAEAIRAADRVAVVDAARASGQLDTAALAAGQAVVLGLFVERDVRAAVERGHRSATCARRLGLRCSAPGSFRVLEDVFNPLGGYFVTGAYDEAAWRAERLDSHQEVQVGSLAEGLAGDSFEAVLFPGARLDVSTRSGLRRGQLHLGFVMLSGDDVFAA